MQSIPARLRDTGQPLDILGLHGASTAFLLSRAVEALQRPLCCIVPADDQLEVLARDIAFSRVQVLTYPSYEIPPVHPASSPDPATVCARLATLHRLHDTRRPPSSSPRPRRCCAGCCRPSNSTAAANWCSPGRKPIATP